MSRNLSFLAIAVFFCTKAAFAAAVTPTCIAQSVNFYESAFSGGCTGPDGNVYTVTNFGFSINAGNPSNIDRTGSFIEMTPITVGNAAGFSFSGINETSAPNSNPFYVTGGSITYVIDYTIDPVITDANLSLDPPFGSVTANQSYCLPNGNCAFLSVSTLTGQLTETSPFSAGPGSIVTVTTSITLDGTLAPAGFDSLNSTTSAVASAVPEPANMALAGVGLCGVLFFAARKRVFKQLAK